MRTPTVTVAASNAKGRKIINKSDFDPGKHTLWSDDERDEFADWSKDDVIDALAGHGIKADKRKSAETLRAELTKVVYL